VHRTDLGLDSRSEWFKPSRHNRKDLAGFIKPCQVFQYSPTFVVLQPLTSVKNVPSVILVKPLPSIFTVHRVGAGRITLHAIGLEQQGVRCQSD
jgi:hypothetical protein